jgi:hypothetical protein
MSSRFRDRLADWLRRAADVIQGMPRFGRRAADNQPSSQSTIEEQQDRLHATQMLDAAVLWAEIIAAGNRPHQQRHHH